MATQNPRVMVVLDPILLKWAQKTSKKEGLSLSARLRDIVRDAYQNSEDFYWAHEGEARLKTMKPSKLISHEAFWKKAGI